jgi:hypothetical protein
MEILFRWVIPQYNFVESRYIPALFFALLLSFTALTSRWEKKLQEGSATLAHVGNYFLIWKMGKLIGALVLFFVCYLNFDYLAFRVFLVLFLLFYSVFMGLEIFALRRIERRYKLSKTEEK